MPHRLSAPPIIYEVSQMGFHTGYFRQSLLKAGVMAPVARLPSLAPTVSEDFARFPWTGSSCSRRFFNAYVLSHGGLLRVW